MKVYLTPPQPSRGLDRIATALRRYAPSLVEVTTDPCNADLTVIYAIGRRQAIERQVADILSRGKRYAVVQACLRSTMTPDTYHWQDIWQSAVAVWSYYDLRQAVAIDNNDGYHPDWFDLTVNFYHAPLGVDASVFYPRQELDGRKFSHKHWFVVGTSGSSRLSESVRECQLAAAEVGRPMFHLGPVKLMDHVQSADNLTDDQVATYLSSCEFVSGLRRKEGFELPAAEGLLCGARPILFDTPDYRWAYKEWGEYIEETDRPGVVDQLVELFKRGARPVTAAEREEAAHWFNWERVCGEFWQRCL